jgi:hypothetical protein
MTSTGLRQALPLVLVLLLLHSAVTPTLALISYETYTGKDGKTPIEQSTEVMAIDDSKAAGSFCVSYTARAPGTTRDIWAYTHVDASTCECMNQYPETYTYYECCATPKCNAPDKARDPVRTIVPTTPGAIPATPQG